jgi:hypothetical protein
LDGGAGPSALSADAASKDANTHAPNMTPNEAVEQSIITPREIRRHIVR